MKKKHFVRKLLFIVIYYGIFFNLFFYFLDRSIYSNRSFHAIYLLMYFLLGIIDTIQRPIESDVKEKGHYSGLIVILFLLNPLLFVLSRWESELYGSFVTIQSIGLILYALAGIVLIMARLQLGEMATSTLVIREDHQLITTGLYKYVRHPLYAASFLGLIAYCLIMPTIFVGLFSFFIYFVVFTRRANYEEGILRGEFGQTYEEYIEKTYKYIPLIY